MMYSTISLADRDVIRDTHERLRRDVRRLRELQAAIGEGLAYVDDKGAFLLLGATDFPLYCEQVLGLSRAEGLQYRGAAECFRLSPGVRDRVLQGKAPLASAAFAGQVLRDPGLVRAGDDWPKWIEEHSSTEVGRMVQQRKFEQRHGGATVRKTIFLTPLGDRRFQDAKKKVIESEQRLMDDSEVVVSLVDHYLECGTPGPGPEGGAGGDGEAKASLKEPLPGGQDAKAGPERKNGKRSRNIPLLERKKVLSLFGDVCWVEGCDALYFKEFAHRTPFCLGGSHSATRLCRLCHQHHRQMDAGVWKPVQGRDGVLMVDVTGNTVGRFRRPPPPA